MTISNFFVPNRQTISSITKANPAVVTTTQSNGYKDGLYVRLVYPVGFGMPQVNGQLFLITVLSPTTFSIPIDSTNFDAFAINSTKQTAQVIPVGEISATLKEALINNRNIIPET